VDLGFAVGGDTLFEAILSNGDIERLSAGSGFVAGVSGSMTPFWAGDRVGFGVAMGLGLKYDSLSGISLNRYPFHFLLQAVLPIDADWFAALRGGIQKDLDVTVSSVRIVSGGFTLGSRWGPVGELALGRMYDAYQLGFAIRYAHLEYTAGSDIIDASNVGVAVSVAFLP
jgi:hypothetical protein